MQDFIDSHLLQPISLRQLAQVSGYSPYHAARLFKLVTSHRKGAIQMNEITSKDMSQGTVFVQVIDRPARRLILKSGIKAEDYFAYCEEVGCEVWDVLTKIKDALYEPAGFWLPKSLRKPGSSEYVQGVEVVADYNGPVPEGFDLIDLPPCQMMVFQGSPFKDEDFEAAIGSLWETMAKYDPLPYGFTWADDDGPRFQLEPQGYRGYIEGRPVRMISR